MYLTNSNRRVIHIYIGKCDVSLLRSAEIYIGKTVNKQRIVCDKIPQLGLVTRRHRKFPYLRHTYDGLKTTTLKFKASLFQ